jgi:MFS transporter, ACS family, tartrate transporter
VQTGFIAALPFLFGSLGCFLWGRHSDQTQERRFHLIGSLLAAGGFLALSTAFETPLVQMIMITIAGFGLYSYLPPFWAMSTAYLAGAGAVGAAAAIGAINAIANIGGFLAPYIFGYLKDATGSYKSGMLGLTALCAIGIVLVLVFSYAVRHTSAARRLVGVGAAE